MMYDLLVKKGTLNDNILVYNSLCYGMLYII